MKIKLVELKQLIAEEINNLLSETEGGEHKIKFKYINPVRYVGRHQRWRQTRPEQAMLKYEDLIFTATYHKGQLQIITIKDGKTKWVNLQDTDWTFTKLQDGIEKELWDKKIKNLVDKPSVKRT